MGFDAVRTHPNDARGGTAEARKGVAEITRLPGAAGGVVLRIEIKNRALPFERITGDDTAVVSRKRETWQLIAFLYRVYTTFAASHSTSSRRRHDRQKKSAPDVIALSGHVQAIADKKFGARSAIGPNHR